MAGRFPLSANAVAVAAGASGVQLCKANPLRWGLLFAWANSSALTVGTLGISPDPLVAAGQGLLLNPGSEISFHYRQHPGMTAAAWFACCQAGGPAVVFVLEEVAQQ